MRKSQGRRMSALIAMPMIALALVMSCCSAKVTGNNRVVVSAIASDGSGGATTAAPGALAPLPAGWPATLGLGLASGQGDTETLALGSSLAFRYQYLAGGVNTGHGWTTWNSDGRFGASYVEESAAHGMIPVLTYYEIRQSSPGNSKGEVDGVTANLRNTGTMAAYFGDLKTLFVQLGQTQTLAVVHVEPDLWGFLQQSASRDDAATVKVQVRNTGMAELAGLPDTAAGMAQAIVKLRDTYAPNVLLGYHLSAWATGVDPLSKKPDNDTLDEIGARSAAFYHSLGAKFDLAFTDASDRDAGFKQYVSGDAGAWWSADDYARNVRLVGAFSRAAGLRVVIWQIPLGNGVMRSMNNTEGHYQDNHVQWLLGSGYRSHLQAYADAGVIALLFGGGAGGTTCACDATGDGVTNPQPVNGNITVATSADDDGGYFKLQAAAYQQDGPLQLAR
jgi:hypothetical protein